MSVKVIVEFATKPGKRDDLLELCEGMAAAGPPMPGSLGYAFFRSADDPDLLVEIADWESSDARAAVFEQLEASGGLKPLQELLAAPLRTTMLETED